LGGRMKKLLFNFFSFLFDTLVAYTWAALFLIPLLNVFLLRSLMKDSKMVEKQLKENKWVNNNDEIVN
jgi:hypothetical protein